MAKGGGRGRRSYVRDARGRFASTPGGGAAKKARPQGSFRTRQAASLARQRGQAGFAGSATRKAKRQLKASAKRLKANASPQQKAAVTRARNKVRSLSPIRRMATAGRQGVMAKPKGLKRDPGVAGKLKTARDAQEASRRTAVFSAKRSKPKETLSFRGGGIKGPTGATLKAYTWQWQWESVTNKEGDEVGRRVSNWDAAVQSAASGRNVVHQFVVERGGKKSVVSAEGALKELGFAGPSAKKFSGIKSALKTYARLRMEQAALQRQMDLVERVRKETKVPKITVKRSGPTPWSKDGGYEIRMGQLSLTQRGGGKYDFVDKNGKLDDLGAIRATRKFRDEAVKRVTGKSPYSIEADLKDVTRRLERQQKKIDELS